MAKANKFARYQDKPFECGTGVEYKPGWYTWEEGAFMHTVAPYEPDPPHEGSIERALVMRGYVVLAPIERDA